MKQRSEAVAPVSDYRAALRDRADALAAEVAASLTPAEASDLDRVADKVHGTLVQQANLELRQILLHLSGQLELALSVARQGVPQPAQERLAKLLYSVERASAVVDLYLDRGEATKRLLRLEMGPFDLAAAVEEALEAQGMLRGPGAVRLELEETPVWGDRAKLVDAVAHLVARFYLSANPPERVVVMLAHHTGHVEGFVGTHPSYTPSEALVEELARPLSMDAVEVDIPYVRALIERHGGTLYVAAPWQDALGFGFTLRTEAAKEA